MEFEWLPASSTYTALLEIITVDFAALTNGNKEVASAAV